MGAKNPRMGINPEQAAEWMIQLNDRYALDGRDPTPTLEYFGYLDVMTEHGGPDRQSLVKSDICPQKIHAER